MFSSLVSVTVTPLLRLICPLLVFAEYSLTEIPENSTPKKNDQEPNMKEGPGQCECVGKMDVLKATWD